MYSLYLFIGIIWRCSDIFYNEFDQHFSTGKRDIYACLKYEYVYGDCDGQKKRTTPQQQHWIEIDHKTSVREEQRVSFKCLHIMFVYLNCLTVSFVYLMHLCLSLLSTNFILSESKLNHRIVCRIDFFRMNKNRMPFVRRTAKQNKTEKKKLCTIIARTRELFPFLFPRFFYWMERFTFFFHSFFILLNKYMMMIFGPIRQKKGTYDHSFCLSGGRGVFFLVQSKFWLILMVKIIEFWNLMSAFSNIHHPSFIICCLLFMCEVTRGSSCRSFSNHFNTVKCKFHYTMPLYLVIRHRKSVRDEQRT